MIKIVISEKRCRYDSLISFIAEFLSGAFLIRTRLQDMKIENA